MLHLLSAVVQEEQVEEGVGRGGSERCIEWLPGSTRRAVKQPAAGSTESS